MSEGVAVGILIAGVAILFVACCAAIARASFSEIPSKANVQVAFYQAAAFAIALIGCLALTQLWGSSVAAVFSIALCVIALGAGWLLSRAWNAREEAELASLEELRRLVASYRVNEASLEEQCARVARTYDLTRKEEAILNLLLGGKTRTEIAQELYVSDNTVKTHIRNLYKKMGVSGKAELVQAVGERSV